MDPFVRVAAIGDLHIRSTVPSQVVKQLQGIEEHADILVIAGDITNGGRILEVELAAELLGPVEIPILSVLGNHDRRTMRRRHFISLLKESGVHVLDGDTFVWGDRHRVGFAGVGGSGGGFWPEEADDKPTLRAYQALAVRARREASKLHEALNDLNTGTKIAILHFAPTVTTLHGEPPVKYPLLGNSALGRVVDDHKVDLVLHGHAHKGSPSGTTPGGVEVRNVALGVTEGIIVYEVQIRPSPTSAGICPPEIAISA